MRHLGRALLIRASCLLDKVDPLERTRPVLAGFVGPQPEHSADEASILHDFSSPSEAGPI